MAVFKQFDHIGIVVGDLTKAQEALVYFFGLEPREQMEIKAAGIRMAFYSLGVGQMELIEFQKPMPEVDPIVLQPRSGVQHVAFQVENFDANLQELTQKGLKVVRGFPREGAHGKVAFFYPPQGLEVMVEICEAREH